MTRKRFKKLCRSLGFSRQMEDNAVFFALLFFGNYRVAWDTLKMCAEGEGLFGEAGERAAEGVGPYGEEATACK